MKIALIFVCFFFSGQILGQTEKEIKQDFPELEKFETVLSRLWNDAVPNKDMVLMKQLATVIDSQSLMIQNAKLPNIFLDKQNLWDEGVKTLCDIIKEYKKAAGTADTQSILVTAEKLHVQYERIYRIFHPFPKEISEFRLIFYSILKYYLPDYQRENIKSSVLKLRAAMDSLNNVSLPDHYKEKRKSFEFRRRELTKSVIFLVKVVTEIDDEKTVKDAVNEAHTKFQALEKVFD